MLAFALTASARSTNGVRLGRVYFFIYRLYLQYNFYPVTKFINVAFITKKRS